MDRYYCSPVRNARQLWDVPIRAMDENGALLDTEPDFPTKEAAVGWVLTQRWPDTSSVSLRVRPAPASEAA